MSGFIFKTAGRRGAFPLALSLLAGALALAGCGDLFAGGSTSTETGDPVSIAGRVTGGNGEGIAGVIVTLNDGALADTTGLSGDYLLSGRRVRAGANAGDTLRFALGGQALAARALSSLTAAQPDLQIVQRGFTGSFSGDAASVALVKGVVKGDGIAAGDSVTATFYHNVLAGNYSGFIWFPPPGTAVRNYTVRVDVHDSTGALTGRSVTVAFTSQAGNVTIPAFNPRNAVTGGVP